MSEDSNQEEYCIYTQFSLADYSYLHDSKGVIYSPFNSEALLCDASVVRFLIQLERSEKPSGVVADFLAAHPEYGQEIIDKLAAMMVIHRR